jgi:hypothetical protein
MTHARPLQSLSDDDLLRGLSDILGQSRRVEADLVAHIAEVDRRRLFAREAAPSMFVYCTRILHLSEPEAYLRIRAARASRRFPLVLDMLADGRLHLSGLGKLTPYLTKDGGEALLLRAAHLSKRQVEELVAEIAPRPDVPATIRKLPERPVPEASADSIGVLVAGSGAPIGSSAPTQLRPDAVQEDGPVQARAEPAPRGVVEAWAPARYKVQFTADADLRDMLERLQGLMRAEVPDGDIGAIVKRAVREKLERLEARRHGRTKAPRTTLAESDMSEGSRHVPAAVRRIVSARDGTQCRFVDDTGRRCPERHRLEYHHRRPFGRGGDRTPANISLLCRTHNLLLAERDFGRERIARYREESERPDH